MENNYVKNNNNPYSAVYRLIDFLFILIVLFAVIYFEDEKPTNLYLLIGLIAAISFSLSAETIQLYRSWRTEYFSRLPAYTLVCWIFAIFMVSIFLIFTKNSTELSRLVIGIWFLVSSIVLVGWRLVFRAVLFHRRRNGFNRRKVAIIGLTPLGVQLADEFTKYPESGFTLEGFFDDRDDERLANQYRDKLIGNVERGVELGRAGKFDIVYVALPLAAQARIDSILRILGDTTVDVHLVPDFFIYNLMNARLTNVGSMQTISVYESPMSGLSSVSKRFEDLIGASLILMGIAIPMLIIALLIKLDSSGPVLFKQKRYGLSGKAINVWKFRSMTVAENGLVVKQATKGDARITRLGAFLRRTSLDELPQFINVLQGQMSIVGPRPHAVAHNEQYRALVDFYMMRHKVKPGITGWAQINGWRGETDTLEKMEKRVEYDLQYIRDWSILLDLKIIFLTLFKGFVNKNAY